MKKYSFIPLLLCASTLALAGCNLLGGSSSSKKSKKKSSSAETSQVSGSSQEGGSSNSSQGGSSNSSQGGNTSTSQGGGATSTSQGGGGNTSTSSGGSSQYSALGIMTDVGTWAWGGIEAGDFKDPDENGIIESNYTIGMEVESPEDSETCLSGVLNSMVTDSEWPSYLSVVDGPTYIANAITSVTPNLGVSEIYLITTDQEFILYMYDYCYDGSVNVAFSAGPTSAFTA